MFGLSYSLYKSFYNVHCNLGANQRREKRARKGKERERPTAEGGRETTQGAGEGAETKRKRGKRAKEKVCTQQQESLTEVTMDI